MAEVDRVEVKVTPDLDGFRAKVTAELSKIRDLKVGLDPDLTGFRKKIQAELAGMRASVDVDVDNNRLQRVASSMTGALRREAPAMKRVVSDSMSAGVDEGFAKAVKEATREETTARRRILTTEAQILRIKDQMLAIDRERSKLAADDVKSAKILQRESDRLKANQLKLGLQLDADRAGLSRASAQLRTAQARLQAQASANPVKQPIEIDVDKDSMRRVSSKMLSLTGSAFRFGGQTVGIAGIGIAASTAAVGLGAMVTQAIPLAAALAQASGAALLLPGAFLGGAAAIGTLVVGMQGVGTAFKDSGDPEKYAEALAKLTPAAQDFVQAGVGLKSVFGDIKATVQEGLFQGLGDELRAWNTNLIPSLGRGMANIAGGLNDVVSDLMSTLGSAKVSKAIETLFGNTGKGLSAASGGFSGFADGLIGLAAGGSKFFEQLGQGFTNAGLKFSRWVEKIASNGQLDRWIRNAMEAFQSIGSILGNIGSALSGIFSAATSSSGNMLNRFDAVTERFASWTNSNEGQDVLGKFFDSVGQITTALLPVGQSLLGVVATIAEGAAGIATAFAPFASKVLDNLNPVIDTIAGILEDIAPPFGEFLDVISQSLGPAFTNLGPGVKRLFESLADAAPDIGDFIDSVGRIGGKVLEGIADVLPTIASGLASMAEFVADVVDAIGPLPAAIVAFVAAMALSGSGDGGSGSGGGGFLGGIRKALLGLGIGAVLDAWNQDADATGWEIGASVLKGIGGGLVAGFMTAGIPGAIAGALIGGIGAAFQNVKTWGSLTDYVKEQAAPTFGDIMAEPIEQIKKYNEAKAALLERGYSDEEAALEASLERQAAQREAYNKGLKALMIETAEGWSQANQELTQRGLTGEELALEESLMKQSRERALYREAMAALNIQAVDGWAKSENSKSDASKKAAKESGDAWGLGLSSIKGNVDGAARDIENGFIRGASSASTAAKSSSDAWGLGLDSIKAKSNDASAQTADGWSRAGSSSQQSAKSTQDAWGISLGQIAASAQYTGGVQANAAIYAFRQNQSSASGSAGAWQGFGSAAGGAVQGFYRQFNTSYPQQASAQQAAGAAAQWSGMYSTGYSLGGRFGEGLAAGVRSNLGAVQAAAAQLAAAARDAVIMAARIASPSKVMIELGEYMGEGFAVGIASKEQQVRSAAKSLTAAAKPDLMTSSDIVESGGMYQFNIIDTDGSIITRTRAVASQTVQGYDSATAAGRYVATP